MKRWYASERPGKWYCDITKGHFLLIWKRTETAPHRVAGRGNFWYGIKNWKSTNWVLGPRRAVTLEKAKEGALALWKEWLKGPHMLFNPLKAVFCGPHCKSGFRSDRASGMIYGAIHEVDARGKRTGKVWAHEEYSELSGKCAYCGAQVRKDRRPPMLFNSRRSRKNPMDIGVAWTGNKAAFVSPVGNYGEVGYSELAMHVGIAGKKVVQYALWSDRGRWPYVRWAQVMTTDGRVTDGLPHEVLPAEVIQSLPGDYSSPKLPTGTKGKVGFLFNRKAKAKAKVNPMNEREWWAWAKKDLEYKPAEQRRSRIEQIVSAYVWHKPPEQVRAMLWSMVSGARARRNSTKGPYQFAEKKKQYEGYTLEQLRFAQKDSAQAARAMKDHDRMAENWYWDDHFTISDEIRRRTGQKTGINPGRRGRKSGYKTFFVARFRPPYPQRGEFWTASTVIDVLPATVVGHVYKISAPTRALALAEAKAAHAKGR
jgi:hypothetical protein